MLENVTDFVCELDWLIVRWAGKSTIRPAVDVELLFVTVVGEGVAIVMMI
jgi:hypothetical protein